MFRISGTLTRVSTLLIAVGLPNSPTSTGNGGLFRGSGRFPSIDSNSAVSSPTMYAPAPMRSSMSNAQPLPWTSVAQQAGRAGLCQGGLETLARQRVLAAQVEVAARGAARERRDGHRLQQRERILLQDDAVLERPGLRLVGVAHDVPAA